ncbi:L-seryl-tRNA(Sec) selenium transferase [Ferrimonas balearica]|uniref:L-seryl-tRNA(Sec) selenium transferase n=1 Tax=Ferrimonas balearica TaxID=44012 RepID=UPI001C95401D|nr:L-seryl-tRNA(Sec) selenium transferase [Ferrimonas balearica]MBY5979426.1 L-seryl-tRNA(Sec) selenium transferase [Ferrimonas balearica]
MTPPSLVRSLPQVEQLLQAPFLTTAITELSRPVVATLARQVLSQLRQQILDGQAIDIDQTLQAELALACDAYRVRRLQRVINGTGTLLHTNLGRAPITPELWREVEAVNTGYSNLELDLARGKRGQRTGLLPILMHHWLGCEAATLVNNNAAVLYLLLNELASGREVIVSRGEQIQIGGGFRIPDILALSGATLVEVGTTNITTVDDYLNAVTEDTALILVVHRSNFSQQGFTASADVGELAQRLPDGVQLVVDQGSGLSDEAFAPEESPIARYLQKGADLVCFSGDKVLGGPQCGIVCGRQDLVKRIERNPLMRAFRPGRIIYALMEALLVRKLNGDGAGRGIAERQTLAVGQTQQWAIWLAEQLPGLVRPVEMEMLVGGGALPGWRRPCWGVELDYGDSTEALLMRLRQMPRPVIAVVQQGRVQLNLATVLEEDLPVLLQQLATLALAAAEGPPQ